MENKLGKNSNYIPEVNAGTNGSKKKKKDAKASAVNHICPINLVEQEKWFFENDCKKNPKFMY